MEMKYYNPSNNFKAPIPREPKPYSPPSHGKAEILIPRPVTMPYEQKTDDRTFGRESTFTEHRRGEEATLEAESLCNCAGGEKTNHGTITRDEWLLLGLILVLFLNGCDDYILLAVLGYLVFSFRQEDTGECRESRQ